MHTMTATSGTAGFLPYLALIIAQLITSSWHVLGKHVMSQVPYLTPIAFVLARTAITAIMLVTLGRVYEGHVAFPPLFLDKSKTNDDDYEVGNGIFDEKKVENTMDCAENGVANNGNGPSIGSEKKHNPSKRRRRKVSSWKMQLVILLRLFLSNATQRKTKNTQSPTINPEIIQIVGASLAGMLLLPLCYTTGLILTNPTVASVWDGPMIPLGVFCTAICLGAEKMSRKRPMGQVFSLLLTVGGSIIVLLVDFLGSHNSIKDEAGETIGHASHWQFIRGNIVLMGIAGAYSATSLLQKRLTHFPPITVTSWMFTSGFVSCCCLLLADSVLYSLRGTSMTGCTFGQAISQLSLALRTSPTFRFGVVYAAFFVGGTCFTIMSYASSHLDASIITLFAAIQPPITAILEWIWEGKELGLKKICGMICVGIGMMCFTRIKKLDAHHVHKRSQNGKHPKSYR